VTRYGGEFRKHDGGIEDRKGLLGASVAWAALVFFPVDCIDHDSANALKRMCLQSAIRFVPLRTASVASFASALATLAADQLAGGTPGFRICRKHG
jgi:hypothetical protein